MGTRKRTLGSRVAAALLVALLTAWGVGSSAEAQSSFRRGDSNADGEVNLSDAIFTFGWLFLGDAGPVCLDAADSTDDGLVDLSDGVAALNFLFIGGDAPPPPGPDACGLDPTGDPLTCVQPTTGCAAPPPSSAAEIGHVLNRIAYGPSTYARDLIETIGLEAYIEQQLNPSSISENPVLATREAALFEQIVPSKDRTILSEGVEWSYFKGTVAPPSTWRTLAFDDSTWAKGFLSIGYGDGDDETELLDMRNRYASVFLRHTFSVTDPAAIGDLILKVDYDDGFVAYPQRTGDRTLVFDGRHRHPPRPQPACK